MSSNKKCVSSLTFRPRFRLTASFVLQGDQIASLYDLLTYGDKPVPEAVASGMPTTTSAWVRSQGVRQ